MPWWVGQLFFPLSYLLVRQGKGIFYRGKVFYDITLPLILSLLILVPLWRLGINVDYTGETGVFRHLMALFQLLVAFYIASLAALASLNSEWLDGEMRGDKPTLHGETITRRKFVLLKFGYLAFMSVVTYLLMLLARVLVPNLEALHAWSGYLIVSGVLEFIVIFLILNLLVTTMIGIYFLMDRIHPESG